MTPTSFFIPVRVGWSPDTIYKNFCYMNQISNPAPLVKDQLFEALKLYFYSQYGCPQDYARWYNDISQVTEGWKMVDSNLSKVSDIDSEFDVPEWFMRATQATL